MEFWRSVDLTGNQTGAAATSQASQFWRSVDLTGNQTVGFREALEDALGEDWDELEYINWR